MADANTMTPEQMQKMVANMTPEMMNQMVSLLSQMLIAGTGSNTGANTGTSNGSNGGTGSVPPSNTNSTSTPNNTNNSTSQSSQKQSNGIVGGFEEEAGIIADNATESYIVNCGGAIPSNIQQVVQEVKYEINCGIELANATIPKSKKLKFVDKLPHMSVARLIAASGNFAIVSRSIGDKAPALMEYVDKGRLKGTWREVPNLKSDENHLRKLIKMYNPAADAKYLECVFSDIKDLAESRIATQIDKKVPVGNGVFDVETKTLTPYEQCKDEYTFLWKCVTDYDENAQNVFITMPDGETWDIESWMKSLSDNPDVVDSLWETIQACVRPGVSWNQAIFLICTTGNNGKGTLCELMRCLVGHEYTTSVPLEQFAKDFELENLPESSCIINDESSDVYLDRVGNLKALITHDEVKLNRKHKTMVDFKWNGIIVQCLNQNPRLKDKTDSVDRRFVFIPMDKCFTGIERKYIKREYIKRDDVLKYILKKVLHDMPVLDAFTYHPYMDATLVEYKAENDPVYEFMEEYADELVWDLVPWSFLYDCFSAYYKETHMSGSGRDGISQNKFTMLAKQWVERHKDQWIYNGKEKVSVGHKMDKPELLIEQFQLEKWMNPDYHGTDPEKKCCPKKRYDYRGMERVVK